MMAQLSRLMTDRLFKPALLHPTVRRWVQTWHDFYSNVALSERYRRFGPGHIFDVRVDDFTFQLTFLDYHPLSKNMIQRIEGRREPETTALIKALVRPGSRVLQVGAAYGYFANIFSRCVGPEGAVVSIEGTPNTFRILQNNILLNALTNVRAYNVFLTAQPSVVFSKADTGPYEAMKRMDRGEGADVLTDAVAVPTKQLSELLDEIAFVPDCIFMDIEGFEAECLPDLADAWLARYQPIIVFEVHEKFYKPDKGLSLILSRLSPHGYHCRRIAGNMLCLPLRSHEPR